MIDRDEVIIIGAGLAGLSAANHLHRAGKRVRILESKNHVGGRVSTDHFQGFILDHGFQVLLTAYPECQAQLDYSQLDLKPFFSGALIYHDKRLERIAHPFKQPLAAISSYFASTVSLADVSHFMSWYVKLHKESVEDVLKDNRRTALECLKEAKISDQLIDLFFRPFLGGVLLDSSLEGPGRMVSFVMKMFFEGQVCVPSQGMQAIPRQLAAKLIPESLLFNTPVAKLEGSDIIIEGSNDKFRAKTLLIATDPWQAARLLGLKMPSPGRRVTCYYFAADESPIHEPALVLNGEREGLVNHVAVMSDVAPSYAPKGSSLISATVLETATEQNEDLVLKHLSKWFGPKVKTWRFLRSYRILNAHPATYPLKLTSGKDPFKISDNVFICGDYLETPTLHSALSMGRKAAEAILKSD